MQPDLVAGNAILRGMPRLRIGFVSMHTSPADAPGAGDAGGMNVVELNQAEALARLGHSVDLITRRARPDAPDALELAPGVTLRHLNAGPQRPLAKSAIDAHIDEFTAGLDTLAPYDLIHSQHWMSGVAALPVARRWGVPHLQSFHSVAALPGSDLGDGEPPESAARVPGEALTARESNLVVAVSTAEARTVIERCGADPALVRVVPPGVDHVLFRPAEPSEVPPPGPWADDPRGYVLFAARLQPLKAPDLAVATLAALPEQRRPHLVIAGDISADFVAYRADLDRTVARAGMRDTVSFVGPKSPDDLARLMRHARVFLIPSHSETFGLVALEAAASGVPVLAAATGGLREVVVHSETGLLMMDRSPETWARDLGRLLADADERRRLGIIARVHSLRFTWRDAAERLARLYLECVSDGNWR